jgi:phasin family protein
VIKFDEFQGFGKDTFEAYVTAANVWQKGMQTMAQEAVEYSRKSMEKGTEALERASAVKSFDKVVEVQQAYAKEAFEGFTAQMNRFGELIVSTSKEAFKPFESKFQSFAFKPAGK